MDSIFRVLVLTLFGLFCLSCVGDGGSEVQGIRVEGGWARAMPLLGGAGGAATNSAIYLHLRNVGDEPDRLTGGATTAAAAVQIHESRVVDDVMRMEEVEGVDILPGEVVELKPGGVHIMLLGLTRSLVEGEGLDLTLHFLRSEDLEVILPVRLLDGR